MFIHRGDICGLTETEATVDVQILKITDFEKVNWPENKDTHINEG